MKRREFIALLGGGAAAWPVAARAQRQDRTRRVGVLMALAQTDPEAQVRAQAFEAGLRDLGWVDGRNLRLDYRWVPDASRLRAQATELVGLAPDLIFAPTTPVVAGLLSVSGTLPIVFVGVTDPVGSGFVKNLARPGGHVTGFTLFEFSIGSKWLEALKEIAPNVKRVAVVFSPDTAPFAPLFWQPVVDVGARSFAVAPIQMPVRDGRELAGEIEALAREPDGGLMILPDVSTANNRDLIIALAARHRLPAVYLSGTLPPAADCSLTAATSPTSSGAPPLMSIAFSRVRSRTICLCKHQPSSNWRSTSRPPRRSASTCRQRCSPAPTR
jgi:putative ABC transport system substrate-binding protein